MRLWLSIKFRLLAISKYDRTCIHLLATPRAQNDQDWANKVFWDTLP